MDRDSINEQVIKNYQDDERTMIQLFVEWCRYHEHDPHHTYHLAYPNQEENPALAEAIADSGDQEPLHIHDNTLLDVLQLFGNEELAFVIADLIEKSSKK